MFLLCKNRGDDVFLYDIFFVDCEIISLILLKITNITNQKFRKMKLMKLLIFYFFPVVFSVNEQVCLILTGEKGH